MNETSESATKHRQRPVRPRDAASLILIRRSARALEVLMGQRHPGHAFMPNRFVFPGGAVDVSDWRVRPATPLPTAVAARLERSAKPARAHALAIAAVRETFEETGLIMAEPADPPPRTVRNAWHGFLDLGLAPALHRLDYFCRAVTPPSQLIRFDARFFVADAEHVTGALRGNGELRHLRWLSMDDALTLPVARITHNVLEEVVRLVEDPPKRRTVPVYRTAGGARTRKEE